jgi:molybdopterin converting factor small subunit
MVIVHLPGSLVSVAGGAIRLGSSPEKVKEALEALWRIDPGLQNRVLTEQGTLRPHVNVFVGSESIRYTGGLETPLDPDSEIFIIPAVSGGASGLGYDQAW